MSVLSQENILWISGVIIVVSIAAAMWRIFSMNNDVHQQRLVSLLGSVDEGIRTSDIADFIRLMGWDKVEAIDRLIHAQSMVKVRLGPKKFKTAVLIHNEIVDQISIAQRVEPNFSDDHDKSNPDDDQTLDGTIHVQGTDWRVLNGTLRRNFEYRGLLGRPSVHRLQIDIDRSESIVPSFFHYHFHIVIAPHLWPDEGEGLLLAGIGPRGAVNSNPFFHVRCSTCDDGSLLISAIERNDANAAIAALAQCVPSQLVLMGPQGTELNLPIPNDDSFSRASSGFFH